MNVPKIRTILGLEGINAWLIYQNQGTYAVGQNPLADEVCGITELITRPWFCLIERHRPLPTWIYQSMEQDKFQKFPGRKVAYSSRNDLVNALKRVLPKTGKIAMEIVADGNIPLLSRVDYGTVSLIKKVTKAQIVSSQNIVGQYTANWGDAGLRSHQLAVTKLVKILKTVNDSLAAGLGKITDVQLTTEITQLYADYDLVTNYQPVVASGQNSGNPHYFSNPQKPKIIKPNEVVLIDIWAKDKKPASIYADITTMFYTGGKLPLRINKAWEAIVLARNAAKDYLQKLVPKSRVRGCDVDAVARQTIAKLGYGRYFTHRLGHNIAQELHNHGTNLDGYETNDSRKIILDTGYSIEPGIYTPDFGLRSEINVYISREGKLTVTTPEPAEIQKIYD
jgi:Xaa-Pro dipeptidase